MDIQGLKPIKTQKQINKFLEKLGEMGAEKITVSQKNNVVRRVNFEGDIPKADIIKLLREIENEDAPDQTTLSEAIESAVTSKQEAEVIKTFLLNNFGNMKMEP